MGKLVLLFIMIVIFVKKGVSFSCLATEIARSGKSEILSKTLKIQNCNEQKKLLNLPIFLTKNVSTSCFKLVGKDPLGNTAYMRGCIQTGGCDYLNTTNWSQNGPYLFNGTKCYECEYENCNLAPKFHGNLFTIFMFCLYGILIA